jgi:hypothetical protein
MVMMDCACVNMAYFYRIEVLMKIYTTNRTRFSGRCAFSLNVMPIAVLLLVVFIAGCSKNDNNITGPISIPLQNHAQAAVSLGSVANFAVLAGSTVTNTGATTINGDLGVSSGTAVTGFPPGILTGTQYKGVGSAAGQAQSDLTTAYNDAAGRTSVDIVTLSGNLGGLTLSPGLYKSTSSLSISSGDLTFDANGDANAIFILQVASTLTTTSGRKVILSGGAQAGNIFWQVGSSVTLGSTSVFKGNILAKQSISLNTGATLEGRALARNGAVTLAGNTIIKPIM